MGVFQRQDSEPVLKRGHSPEKKAVQKEDSLPISFASENAIPKSKMGNPFRLLSVEAYTERTTIDTDESSATVFKYRTPHFCTRATIQIPPLAQGEQWQVGWIQACSHMHFVNEYGNYGSSSWEFPELTTQKHKMISDSDGTQYPWYGSRTEVATAKGPNPVYQTVIVSMNDNFNPHITWTVPLDGEIFPKLTCINRDQHFYTWLLARNLSTNQYLHLKTIFWTMKLQIDISPTKPLGQRVLRVMPTQQNQPIICRHTVPIEHNVMKPPNANGAQMLIWRSRTSVPRIIVPRKIRSTMSLDRKYRRKHHRSPRSNDSQVTCNGRHSAMDSCSKTFSPFETQLTRLFYSPQ